MTNNLGFTTGGGAVFSFDRTHRFLLNRELRGGSGICCFVLLNPSRADEHANDPTISRCIGFAARWGFSQLLVVNLFSLMTSDPVELARSSEPGRLENDHYLVKSASDADLVVAGWGVHGSLFGRSHHARRLLGEACIDLHAFGITKNDEPRHPLYMPYSSPLRPLPVFLG